MTRSEFTANVQLSARVAPASWTRPAPVRQAQPQRKSLVRTISRLFTS